MRLRAAAPDRGDRRQRGVLFHGVHAAVPRTVVPQIHHGMAGTARHRTGGHAPVRHERPVGAAVPVHSARGRGPACLLGGTIGPAETPIDALLRSSGELSVRGGRRPRRLLRFNGAMKRSNPRLLLDLAPTTRVLSAQVPR